MCCGPDVWGHGDRPCPGPAAPQKGREHTKPVVGLTFALARLASQQFRQLLHVGLLWEFRGPGKWLGRTAGPSGSFRDARNTYVTVSEGRLGDEAKDKSSVPHAGLGWAWVPPSGPSGQQGPSLISPPAAPEASGGESRGGERHPHSRAVRLFTASPTGSLQGLAHGRSQGTSVE